MEAAVVAFARVLRGAQRAAAAAGYTVALIDTGNDRRWVSSASAGDQGGETAAGMCASEHS